MAIMPPALPRREPLARYSSASAVAYNTFTLIVTDACSSYTGKARLTNATDGNKWQMHREQGMAQPDTCHKTQHPTTGQTTSSGINSSVADGKQQHHAAPAPRIRRERNDAGWIARAFAIYISLAMLWLYA